MEHVIRVLCVEDNDGDYRLMTELLRRATFDLTLELQRAVRLNDALHLIDTAGDTVPFHVVLLDLSLPDSHGLETFHVIRKAAPDAAITILSGNSDEEIALAMVQLGAQDYLPKDLLTSDVLMRSIIYSSERQRLLTDVRQLNEQLVEAQEDVRSMQMQVIQAEKLDSLGRIAASVAHEVKNPLATLQMGTDFFDSKRSLIGPLGSQMVDCMQEAIERADRIIHEMLDFSRSEDLNILPGHVNAIVAGAIRMILPELVERKVTLVEDYGPANPCIRADRSKLEQVIINLVINGAQAMRDGGIIEVRTSQDSMFAIPRDEGLREMDLMKTGDDMVVIEIRDHGSGIQPHLIDRIFEPFFTTKPTGEGTGLGLPVAKRIVELHRGYLQVANADPPPGVRVRILLKSDLCPPHNTADEPDGSAGTNQPATTANP